MNDTPMETEAAAGPGHNNPPPQDPLLARLSEQHADLLQKVEDFIAACGRAPKPVDEASAQKVTDFLKQIGGLRRKVDAERKDAKEPYLDAGRKVDGFFNARRDRLDEAIEPVRNGLDQYVAQQERKRREEERLRREEAARAPEGPSFESNQPATTAPAKTQVRGEYGGVASARKVTDFEIEDASKIPVAILRRYLTKDAIEKAVRSAVRAGERDIKGVRIFETTKAQVR